VVDSNIFPTQVQSIQQVFRPLGQCSTNDAISYEEVGRSQSHSTKCFSGRGILLQVCERTSARHGAPRSPAFGGMNPLTPSGRLRRATGAPCGWTYGLMVLFGRPLRLKNKLNLSTNKPLKYSMPQSEHLAPKT
jgi:hypothetical protein